MKKQLTESEDIAHYFHQRIEALERKLNKRCEEEREEMICTCERNRIVRLNSNVIHCKNGNRHVHENFILKLIFYLHLHI